MRNSALLILNLFIILIQCLYIGTVSGGTGFGAVPSLLFATHEDIRLVSTIKANSKPKVQPLVKNLTQGFGLDINYAAQKICWTDQGLETIQCISYNGVEVGKEIEEVITTDLILPEGLACDWFTNKLYWTDSDTNKIEVATMDGKHRKVLIWSDIDQPRMIALVPMRAILFWTDWGEVPKIERVGMNGDPATRSVIISENIFWPNGLTVDYENELLYWIDGKLRFIDVVDYNGKNRRTVVKDASDYPFALTLHQNKLYWTDWKMYNLYTVEIDKNTTVYRPKELIPSKDEPMCIQIWEPTRQPLPAPGQNPCSQNNGGCSHLCLLAPYPPGFTCACPIGIKLITNKTCASGPEEVLLYAVRTGISIMYLDSGDYTYRTLPLTGIKYSIAVDYDPVNGYLYWSDDEVKAIRRARLNGSNQEDVIVNDVHHPDGLAVDWVAGNIYWTDTGSDRIEVSRLNGLYRRVLVHEGLLEPRGIVVAPEHGWIFWSDWNEKLPKIERASLDGSQRIALINSSLGWPNGLTLDLDMSKIYWCDAKIDKIEVANMDGTDRMELIFENLPHTFGLSLMGDYIYWTDWQRRSIDRAHKITGENRTIINDQAVNVMGIKAVRLNDTRGNNPCRHSNGGCAQLCLNRPQGKYVCACQMGYELRLDNRTCVLPDSFLLYTRNHTIGRISIENGNNGNNRNDASIPVSGVKQGISLDFDGIGSRMYWADVRLNAIYRAYINGSDTEKVIDLGTRASTTDAHISLAVDWLADNVYWTDALAHKIEVARLDGSSRRALLWQGLNEPRDIVLYPAYGLIFWSEWGTSNSIKRAAMDGSMRSVLVSNTGHAKGLTVDYDDPVLFWVNVQMPPGIHRIQLDGKNRKEIITANIHSPTGLTMYKDRIYWSDSKTDEIYSANKRTGGDRTTIYSKINGIFDLVVVHRLRQDQTNQCSVENGGCTNLCLALPGTTVNTRSTSHICSCPTHFALINNTCVAPNTFMIYSQRNSVVRLLPDSIDYPEAVLPVQGLNRIKAVDFDPVTHYLYWIDGKTHSIKRALDNGSAASVIVHGAPYDLAVDSLGRLLFWSCSDDDVINVTRLDNGSTVGVVVTKDQGLRPRLLAIHTTLRWLFWTDNGDPPRLTRARLDGSHRMDIVMTKQNITALALDLDNDMVVWAEGSHVYMVNIDGDNKHSLSEMKPSVIVTQLAVHGGYVFWVERSQLQLHKLDLRNGGQEVVRLAHGTQALTDLVAVKAPPANHSCAAAHRCSHICIGNATTLECACPYGLALQDDRKSCSPVPDCGRDHFTCGRNRYSYAASNIDCIPASWRCDGQADCADGSDEVDCHKCRPEEFRCQNGDCIDQTDVCDGVQHCTDASDEMRCCTSEQFKCPRTDVCIPRTLLCNNIDDCADGTDESDDICSRLKVSPVTNTATGSAYVVSVIVTAILTLFILAVVMILRRRCITNRRRGRNGIGTGGDTLPMDDQSTDPLNPKSDGRNVTVQLMRTGIGGVGSGKLRGNVPPPDVVRMSMLSNNQHALSQSSSACYDRCHITGASSSTNGSSLACYPRETLNPPPSPATTANSSPGPRHRPYRHYRSINQPPPPTPCSTDVCDESDCNYPYPYASGSRNRYDAGPFPPPPTPRSHCHSESCPPSPSSRSSTYFSPLPPPPSPVPSTPYRGYES